MAVKRGLGSVSGSGSQPRHTSSGLVAHSQFVITRLHVNRVAWGYALRCTPGLHIRTSPTWRVIVGMALNIIKIHAVELSARSCTATYTIKIYTEDSAIKVGKRRNPDLGCWSIQVPAWKQNILKYVPGIGVFFVLFMRHNNLIPSVTNCSKRNIYWQVLSKRKGSSSRKRAVVKRFHHHQRGLAFNREFFAVQ